ncbi:MAG: NAD-dependent epimerase/dehydratase family protein, partial [Zetaproteobacteria bacterium]
MGPFEQPDRDRVVGMLPGAARAVANRAPEGAESSDGRAVRRATRYTFQDVPAGARMSRRVVVTGATGFIGRHVSRHLVASGADVRAVLRPESTQTAPAGVATVRAPLEPSALDAAFGGADVVVHLAGVTSAVRPQTYTDVNVQGARAVATAARRAGARLIHISSLAAAG